MGDKTSDLPISPSALLQKTHPTSTYPYLLLTKKKSRSHPPPPPIQCPHPIRRPAGHPTLPPPTANPPPRPRPTAKPRRSTDQMCPGFPAMRVKGLKLPLLVT